MRLLLRIADSAAWAIWIYRLERILYQKNQKRLALIFCYLGRWLTSVEIRPSAELGKNISMPHPNGIIIGEYVRVGNSVVILQQVTLGALRIKEQYTNEDVPCIEDGVMLCAGSKVLGGVKVGCNSVVAANAVVLTSIPPNATAVGVPAKVVTKTSKSR